MNRLDAPTANVHLALQRSATTVTEVAPAAWHVEWLNGKRVRALARLDGDWLDLSLPLGADLADNHPWGLLECNAQLPGGARLAQQHGQRVPHLRVDAYVGERSDAGRGVRDACTALVQARGMVTGRSFHGSLPVCQERPQVPVELAASDWLPLLGDLPWSNTALDDGSVRLDVDGRRGRAYVVVRGDAAGVKCTVNGQATTRLTESSRTAIGLELMMMSSALRLVRPVVESVADGLRIGFETVSALPLERAELELALGALMVAWEQSGPAIRALGDGVLARAYLDVTMPSHRPASAGAEPHPVVAPAPGSTFHRGHHVVHRST